jgi:CheY-like chemotaxis protein
MEPLNILVIDDEQSICLLLNDVLVRFGHTVTTCNDGLDGLAAAQTGRYNLVMCDIRMPGMDGLEALKQLRLLQPGATFVMITGFAKDDIIDKALQSGASACLAKPFSLSQVKQLVEEVVAGARVSV